MVCTCSGALFSLKEGGNPNTWAKHEDTVLRDTRQSQEGRYGRPPHMKYLGWPWPSAPLRCSGTRMTVSRSVPEEPWALLPFLGSQNQNHSGGCLGALMVMLSPE